MEPLEDTLFQQLAFACSEIRQSFDRHIGMSQPRRQLLTLLSQQGELSHAALQQHLSLDGATITRLVKQFEAEGVLSRRLDPQNNRYTLVSLTDAGQQIVAGLRVAHSTFQTLLLEGITREEQAVMVRALERLRTNVRGIQEQE
ncbi:MAG: MarR family transcriptional regulator [Ktedonobacteraceae bacterium]|nr:MarR family transcriptional regulator [Ktedonobacteraceae bacterium]